MKTISLAAFSRKNNIKTVIGPILLAIISPLLVAPVIMEIAQANDIHNVDSSALNRCLMEKSNNQDLCIGSIYNICTDDPANTTTNGMKECHDAEYRAWDKILNKKYSEIMLMLEGNDREYFKKSELNWLNYVKQKCEWPNFIYPNGTIKFPLVKQCMSNETAFRTIFLNDISTRLLEIGK